jgi:pyruvate,water dikinase
MDLDIKSEIKGHCASKGKIKGVVKVCRGEAELSKIQDGDVLVVCMTQPEFLPAMKKASAVITDEGGLTCHAVLSRENCVYLV